MKLYHLTTPEALPNILKEGLIPKYGNNSEINEENGSYIYLTCHDHIPYWYILTGNRVLLKVNVEEKNLIWRCYDCYDEGIINYPINPSNIKIISDPIINTTEAMIRLSASFLHSIKYIYNDIYEIFKYGKNYLEREKSLNSYLKLIKRIDFSYLFIPDTRKNKDLLEEDIDLLLDSIKKYYVLITPYVESTNISSFKEFNDYAYDSIISKIK